MQEQKFKAKEKKVNRMTRSGLVEENLATKGSRKLTDKQEELSFKKSDAEQSFAADREERRKPQKKEHTKGSPENKARSRLTKEKEENDPAKAEENAEEPQESSYPDDRRKEPRESAVAIRERRARNKRRYHNQKQVKASRLQFDKMEADGSLNQKQKDVKIPGTELETEKSRKLIRAEEKSKKAAQKLEHAKKHQTQKKSMKLQRVREDVPEGSKYCLYFEETPKAAKTVPAVKKAGVRLKDDVGNLAHNKIRQEEQDNSAVQATHKGEQAGEALLRQHSNRNYRKQRKQQSSLNRLERKTYLANTNYQYRKWLEEHPEEQKKLFRKMLQKQRIKREYKIAYRAGKIQKETQRTTLKMADISTKVARKVQEMLVRNSTVIVSGLLLLILLLIITTGISSCYEIEHNAIEISKKNYPEIVRGGDVTKEDFTKYKGKIDILIGGSPCQNLCSCGNRKGLEGEESRLFFDYVRALYETEAKWFLLENNATMTKENQDIITGIMGVEPIYINSNLLTAQERKRLYWTNIPDIKQPEDKGIFLRDIVQPREEKKEYECYKRMMAKEEGTLAHKKSMVAS